MTISLDIASAAARTSERDFGLTTEKHKRINEMLRELDPRLSLRMIPERDPAFNPPKTMGVWEDDVKNGLTNWVLTIEPEHVDARLVARVAAGDMSKLSPAQRIELLKRVKQAEHDLMEAAYAEKMAQRKEEMLFIASARQGSVRHTIDGEDRIISDEPGGRSPRTYV